MCFLPNVSVAGGGERLPMFGFFLILLYLSDRRGPVALDRGEVPPSTERGVAEDPLWGLQPRGNRLSGSPTRSL